MNDFPSLHERGQYFYLASPYSSPDKSIEQARYEEVMWFAAQLTNAGWHIYCPIMHCHEMAKRHKLATDAATWRAYNCTMIRYSRGLFIADIDGWEVSKGVTQETQFARDLSMRIRLVTHRTGERVPGVPEFQIVNY